MREVALYGGPLHGVIVTVENSGYYETPATLPITYKGQSGQYWNLKDKKATIGNKSFPAAEWRLCEQHDEAAIQPIKTTPPLHQRGTWPSPVPKPAAVQPIVVAKQADIPPPPKHIAAGWTGCDKSALMKLYVALYSVKTGIKPTNMPKEARKYGLVRNHPGIGLCVTEKGEALFLTSDQTMTDRYLNA